VAIVFPLASGLIQSDGKFRTRMVENEDRIGVRMAENEEWINNKEIGYAYFNNEKEAHQVKKAVPLPQSQKKFIGSKPSKIPCSLPRRRWASQSPPARQIPIPARLPVFFEPLVDVGGDLELFLPSPLLLSLLQIEA
jgi:hypothetical protein